MAVLFVLFVNIILFNCFYFFFDKKNPFTSSNVNTINKSFTALLIFKKKKDFFPDVSPSSKIPPQVCTCLALGLKLRSFISH